MRISAFDTEFAYKCTRTQRDITTKSTVSCPFQKLRDNSSITFSNIANGQRTNRQSKAKKT